MTCQFHFYACLKHSCIKRNFNECTNSVKKNYHISCTLLSYLFMIIVYISYVFVTRSQVNQKGPCLRVKTLRKLVLMNVGVAFQIDDVNSTSGDGEISVELGAIQANKRRVRKQKRSQHPKVSYLSFSVFSMALMPTGNTLPRK